MKICVFGAGAIGGFLAARLAAAEVADVTVVARGPHLAAIQSDGLTLMSEGRTTVHRVAATDDPAQAGPQDYVVLTLKAHSLPPAADSLQPLLGPDTALVAAINGIPWWYFHKLPGPFEDRRVDSVDPGGRVWERLHPSRVIGAIVYPAAEVPRPGVVEHGYGDRFSLGEPDGSRSERIRRLSEALIKAGLKAPVRPRIRDELWVKLWGNLAFNPISALTGAHLDVLLADPGTHALARAMMVEGQAVAEALGITFAIDVDKRLAGGAEVGHHKTSMLQDLERGRPMEIEALLGSVVELAGWVEVPVPTCGAILALVRQRARLAGCYPQP